MILISSCSCLCPNHWSQVLSREWRCSWSSADRRCSNYIWVISNFNADQGAAYIRRLTEYIYIYTYIYIWLVWFPTRRFQGDASRKQEETCGLVNLHNNVMAWNRFPYYCFFVMMTHRGPMDSPNKTPVTKKNFYCSPEQLDKLFIYR